MKIVKSNIATIANNNPEGSRVRLSIASETEDGITIFFIVTGDGEDCGPHFDTAEEAEDAIFDLWGNTDYWDLQYT